MSQAFGHKDEVVIGSVQTAGLSGENTAPDFKIIRASSSDKPVSHSSSHLSRQISSLQSGITNILEAGGRMLVSEKKVTIHKGDTLMDVLVNKAGAAPDEAQAAIRALAKVYDPRNIVAGREITVFFHNDPAVADPTFSGVRIDKDVISSVTVNRGAGGAYVADKAEKAVHKQMKGFKGVINSSLYADAKAAGVPDGIILDLIKMYSWNVDFQREIHEGDRFEVMYEQHMTEDGAHVPGRGAIHYARLTLAGTAMPFYRFEDKNGGVDYYDDTGRSAKKPLMKTPIDGARLSSGFGMRNHPVLGYSKMHKGVDFAAARGTPIYAAGDGVVTKAGPFSSYGNYVRIRHRDGLDTAYAHMSRFKPGLRAGQRVKQGEVIGYVGTTGRSTGPHLHYEVMLSGNQVNPMSVKLPTGQALKGRDLQSFKAVLAQLDRKFNDIGRDTAVASSARGPSLGDSAKLSKN